MTRSLTTALLGVALLGAAGGCGGHSDATSSVDASAHGGGDVNGDEAGASEGGTIADASDDGYPASCILSTSSYDTSCTVDSDCVSVTTGNYCVARCLCGGAAISASSLAQFDEAASKTPLGSGALGPGAGACPCAPVLGPCCRQGTCAASCSAGPSDTLPACADAGGTCIFSPAPACTILGPPGSCAFSDEACCAL